MDIKVEKVNSYTQKVIVGDKEILVTDNSIKYRKIRQFSKIVCTIGATIGLFSFLYLVGLAGRSDYMTEAHILDDWTFTAYMIRSLIGMIGMLIAYAIYKFDERFKFVNYKAFEGFEN